MIPMNAPIAIDQYEYRTHHKERMKAPERDRLKSLVPAILNQLPSPHSRRMYARYLKQFLDSQTLLTRDGIAMYQAKLKNDGAKLATVNLHLSVIRKLVVEAEIKGWIEHREVRAIYKLRRNYSSKTRMGNWLTHPGARKLLESIPRQTPTGKRDAAMFALLLGCGLRREEAVTVKWAQYTDRDGRKVLLNIEGKGQKTRTVPVSDWAVVELDIWRAESLALLDGNEALLMRSNALRRFTKRFEVPSAQTDITDASREYKRYDACLDSILADQNAGNESVNETGNEVEMEPETKPRIKLGRGELRLRLGGDLSAMGCWWLVKKYAGQLGIEIAPHDMRRTLAQFMRRAGAELEQIQFQLGHSDIKTTQIYLGGSVELQPGKAGVDKIEW